MPQIIDQQSLYMIVYLFFGIVSGGAFVAGLDV